jgi:hypothetical protein
VRFCSKPIAAILAQSSSIPASLVKRRTLSFEGVSKRNGTMMRSSPLLVAMIAGAVFFALDPVAFLAAAVFVAAFLIGCLLMVITLSKTILRG